MTRRSLKINLKPKLYDGEISKPRGTARVNNSVCLTTARTRDKLPRATSLPGAGRAGGASTRGRGGEAEAAALLLRDGSPRARAPRRRPAGLGLGDRAGPGASRTKRSRRRPRTWRPPARPRQGGCRYDAGPAKPAPGEAAAAAPSSRSPARTWRQQPAPPPAAPRHKAGAGRADNGRRPLPARPHSPARRRSAPPAPPAPASAA